MNSQPQVTSHALINVKYEGSFENDLHQSAAFTSIGNCHQLAAGEM